MQDRREDGFTLAEALAALAVLALAMGQVGEIMNQFIRATGRTKESVRSAKVVLADLVHVSAGAGVSRRVVIDEQIFAFDAPGPPRKPCLFDATGRRCR